MKPVFIALFFILLAGCQGTKALAKDLVALPGQVVEDVSSTLYRKKEALVTQVGDAATCGSLVETTKLGYFPTLESVRQYEKERGIELLSEDSVAAPFVLITLGKRVGEGYGLTISRNAYTYRSKLWLSGTFFVPDLKTEEGAESSPCVLVSIPSDDYEGIVLTAPDGKTVKAELKLRDN